jgi:hypothetical protein
MIEYMTLAMAALSFIISTYSLISSWKTLSNLEAAAKRLDRELLK